MIGAIASFAVGKRAPSVISKLDEKFAKKEASATTAQDRKIPPHRSPDALGRICVWAADCVQSSIVLTGPAVSALLLAQIDTPLLGLAYLGVGVLGAGIFVWLLFANPDRYTQQTWLFFTPVALLGIILNVVLAIVVWVAVT
jgi:hypothetical protein